MAIIPAGMTIYARWPRWAAWLVLLTSVALIVWPAIPLPKSHSNIHYTKLGHGDIALQKGIIARVARGENYYLAAGAEQRANGYPTTPPQAIRQPLLAWWLAWLKSPDIGRASLLLLLVAATIAMRDALDRTSIPKYWRLPATLCQISGFAIAWHSFQIYVHETWAALLIALSLALYRPNRYWLSIAIAVLACLIRELALPFMMVMTAFAILERRWREALVWPAGAMVFLLLFALHLHAALQAYAPGDYVSPGWVYFSGWRFVLETARLNEILYYAPAWVVAAAALAGVLGLTGWRDPLVARAALIVGGYMLAFLVVGRPDNQYWGELYSPLLPLGWVLAPAALYDLVRRALPARSPAAPPEA